MFPRILILLAATSPAFARSQPPALPPALPPLPAFTTAATTGTAVAADAPRIDAPANPSHPVSVVGPRGALLGFQDGSYEAWIFPWKLFANMRISARMHDYPVPIDVNAQASGIRVRPWATTITYSHANFTIRQIMLAPQHAADGTGVIVLYRIE
ncbi:MAG TPA: hypothetical protein VMU86_08260, partial [Steroidobacteraceae bacterium]|nr:hypothetical protein [Steroidobacteraceae bacterium]